MALLSSGHSAGYYNSVFRVFIQRNGESREFPVFLLLLTIYLSLHLECKNSDVKNNTAFRVLFPV